MFYVISKENRILNQICWWNAIRERLVLDFDVTQKIYWLFSVDYFSLLTATDFLSIAGENLYYRLSLKATIGATSRFVLHNPSRSVLTWRRRVIIFTTSLHILHQSCFSFDVNYSFVENKIQLRFPWKPSAKLIQENSFQRRTWTFIKATYYVMNKQCCEQKNVLFVNTFSINVFAFSQIVY